MRLPLISPADLCTLVLKMKTEPRTVESASVVPSPKVKFSMRLNGMWTGLPAHG
jgi:hypothetical protein